MSQSHPAAVIFAYTRCHKPRFAICLQSEASRPGVSDHGSTDGGEEQEQQRAVLESHYDSRNIFSIYHVRGIERGGVGKKALSMGRGGGGGVFLGRVHPSGKLVIRQKSQQLGFFSALLKVSSRSTERVINTEYMISDQSERFDEGLSGVRNHPATLS